MSINSGWKIRLAVVSLMAITGVAANAAEVAIGDTYLSPTVASTPQGNSVNVNAIAGNATGLFQFALSSLPGGTTSGAIASANMTVFVNKVATIGKLQFYVVNGNWAEATADYNLAPAVNVTPFYTSQTITAAGTFVTVDVTSVLKSYLDANPGYAFSIAVGSDVGSMTLDSKENIATSHPSQLNVVLTGPAGPAGATGATGANGAPGATGATGANGAPGAIGPTGANGAPGAIGPTGPAGTNGTNGTNGATGPTGAAGQGFQIKGAWGPAGTYVIGDTVTVNGSSYVNITGANNGSPDTDSADWTLLASAGATGATGANGTAGATGPTGPAGTNGTNGATGPTGPAGPTGLTGTSGTAGATGAQGATGATGAQGPTGPAGGGGVNAQTVNYTAVSGDTGKLITMNVGTSPVLTLPSPVLGSTWFASVENLNATPLSITPAGGLKLNGATTSMILTQYQVVLLWSDGSNYFAKPPVLAGNGLSMTSASNGITMALAAPTASVLGGVTSATAGANQFMTGVNTSGAPTFSQPAFSNLSGTATNLQLQNSSVTVVAGTNLSGGGTVSLGGSVTLNALAQIPIYNSGGTAVSGVHLVSGQVTLGTGGNPVATVTLSGSAVFTSGTSYACVAMDITASHYVSQNTGATGTTFTLNGTGGDTVSYICIGN